MRHEVWVISNPYDSVNGELTQKISVQRINLEKRVSISRLTADVKENGFHQCIEDLAQLITRNRLNNPDVNYIITYDTTANLLRGYLEEYLDREKNQ